MIITEQKNNVFIVRRPQKHDEIAKSSFDFCFDATINHKFRLNWKISSNSEIAHICRLREPAGGLTSL